MNKPAVEFFFDFSSPYSYIASEWVEALAARRGGQRTASRAHHAPVWPGHLATTP